MLDKRTEMLVATVRKLYRRGAKSNVQKVLFKSHTADVAAMLEVLEGEERYEVFLLEKSADERAEVFSYLKPEVQRNLAENLSVSELAVVVSKMDSDDAADLMGELPAERSREVLSKLAKKDQEDVGDLMGYPKDTAGGLMSTDVLALQDNLKVTDAIRQIQEQDSEQVISFYIYVVDENNHLVGVVSLKTLLLSKGRETLSAIMNADVISVDLETDQQEVAEIVARYDFLCLPVVDKSNKLLGVITVDDVIDVIREEAEENVMNIARTRQRNSDTFWGHVFSRMPWLVLTFVGASISFYLVFFFGSRLPGGDGSLWLLASFLPIILSMGATAGGQAATVTIGEMVAGHFDTQKWLHEWLYEFLFSLVYAVFFAFVVMALGIWFFESHIVAVASGALALQIILSMSLGTLVPMVMHRLGMDATFSLVPLFTAVADIAAVSVLFGLAFINL